MRRLLAISALTLAACTPSGTNDAFTVPDPPDGLALTTIEEYELTERTHESTGDATFTAEEIRLHQAMTGGSMTLGGGTRQVYGADQGSAASWNDINNLAGEAGFVLSTFPMTGDHGIEVVRAIRNPLGVSAAQITDQSGGLITAAASNSETDTSYFLVWQQSKHWIVLYSDTVPLSDLTSIAGRVAPARLSNLQDELNG